MLPTVRLPLRIQGNWAAASGDPVRRALRAGPVCVGPDGLDTLAPAVPAARDSEDLGSRGQELMRVVICRGPLGVGLYRWGPIAPATCPLPEPPCMRAAMVGASRKGVMRWTFMAGPYSRDPLASAAGRRGNNLRTRSNSAQSK